MSKADEMFEKLGYRLEHSHYNCNDIYTYYESSRNNLLRFETSSQSFYSLFFRTYNAKELQAINEKVKELGWL